MYLTTAVPFICQTGNLLSDVLNLLIVYIQISEMVLGAFDYGITYGIVESEIASGQDRKMI